MAEATALQKEKQPWHAQPAEFAITDLKTTPAGLSASEAQARLEAYGLNRLPAAPKRGVVARFLLQFHNILIYVLLGASVITALLNHLTDTFVILAVVTVNAIIGFIQEGKAERAIDAIRQMLALRSAVLRGGERRTVAAERLVPGDVVLLEAGDKVPADLRLLQAHGLQAQEAILTGESVPIEKRVEQVAADAVLGDRSNMVFSGTLITSGQGRGVVVATGAATEIGRISGMLSEVEALTTPLVEQMSVFARWLTFLILLVAALLLGFGHFVLNHDFVELFMVIIGLSVAAIPEGLPAVLTVTLAIGVQAMARRNAIIRRLPAIETLGSVSVICTDKTGTLTRNEMMVASVMTYQNTYTIEGEGYAPDGEIRLGGGVAAIPEHPVLAELAQVAALCNDSVLHEKDAAWSVEGDPMEGALLAFTGKAGLDYREERRIWARRDTIPFDSRHRFMATLHHDHEKHAFIFVKGAPEQILSMCERQRTADGGVESLQETWWRECAEAIAAKGQRVLALAMRPASCEHVVLERADVEGQLILLGLVGLIDPPRQDAIRSVADCRLAGIRVKMITGDHAGTAKAIGKQVGLRNADKVLTGGDLDTMDDATLAAAVLDVDIFARTSPKHKLRLVMALQEQGLIVAMTGDGVNDAPALKRTDAGIAMGRKGSEAAKEASDLVLADDNFSSIVAAVHEGRVVYDNVKKVISWTLPTNAGEAAVIIAALLSGMPMPLTAVQILWINLVTDSALGVALAFEPIEDKTKLRPPRPRNESLLTGGLAWHIVLVSFLFLCGTLGMFTYAVDRGYAVELARTIAVNTLVVMEIFHLFFIRNIYGAALTWKTVRATRAVWLAVISIVAAQCAITYIPFLQNIFSTQAVPFFDGALIIAVGAAFFAIVEIEKQIRLRLRAGP